MYRNTPLPRWRVGRADRGLDEPTVEGGSRGRVRGLQDALCGIRPNGATVCSQGWSTPKADARRDRGGSGEIGWVALPPIPALKGRRTL